MSTLRLSDLDFAGVIYEFEDLLAQNRLDHLTYPTLTAMEEDASLEVNDSAVVNGGIFDVHEVIDVENEEDMTDPDTIYYYNDTHYDGNSGNEAIGFETVNGFAMLSDKNVFVTPEMFGAKGDGTTEDTVAINAAVKSLNGRTLVLTGRYFVRNGLEYSTPFNIVGVSRGAGVNAGFYSSGANSTFKLVRNIDDPQDFRNYIVKNVTFANSGTGDALEINGYGDYLMETTFDNCRFMTPLDGTGGYGIRLVNSLAHSQILNSTFQGNGIYMNCRDANAVRDSMFFGAGHGILLQAETGCMNNLIDHNTFVNHGKGNGVCVNSGDNTTISNNTFEYGGNDTHTAEFKSLLAIYGPSSPIRNCIIKDNNFGGGTYVDDNIHIYSAYNTVIENNRLVACNNSEIKIRQYAYNTAVGYNFGVGTQSNPRTNKKYRYIVDDEGQGTIGVWRELAVQGNAGRTLPYMKTKEGLVIFDEFYIPSLTEPLLATLPNYYKPTNTKLVILMSPTNNMQLKATISWNGEIRLLDMPETQGFFAMPPIYVAGKYLS